MSTAAMTSMLIDRLQVEHPGRVMLVSEASLSTIRGDPGWGRVGAYPIGSPDFLRPCKRHLQAGRRLVIVDIHGKGIHIYANKKRMADEEMPGDLLSSPGLMRSDEAPESTVHVPGVVDGRAASPVVTTRVAPAAPAPVADLPDDDTEEIEITEDEDAAEGVEAEAAPQAHAVTRVAVAKRPAPPQRRRRSLTPMIRASSLEARPATGVAPFTTHLKELPDLDLLDALPPPVGAAQAELAAHEAELLTIPLHSAWPVFAFALREAHVDGDTFLASYYLFPTAAAERRRQAVGQLHVKARVGEPGLSDAWVEGSGLVFDRHTEPEPAGPSEVLELGAAGADDDEDEDDDEDYITGGGFSLQVLFQQAEEAVERKGPERAAQAPVAPRLPEPTLPPPPRPSAPPKARGWELPPLRVLVGFGVFLLLCAYKVMTDLQDAEEVATHVAEGRLPPLEDPFEASPLDPLPGDVVATVERAGKPMVVGPIRRPLLNRYVRLVEPDLAWCYHAFLLEQPEAEQAGEVELKFVLSETGALAQAEIGQSELKGAGLDDCLKDALAKVPFPKPEVASVTAASYKFRFGLQLPVAEEAP